MTGHATVIRVHVRVRSAAGSCCPVTHDRDVGKARELKVNNLLAQEQGRGGFPARLSGCKHPARRNNRAR
jgi:hypothetical protein